MPHRALVNFLTAMARTPGLQAEDRLLAVTTLSFDIAALELYLPLCVGARVIVASRAVATNGEELARQLEVSGATVMQATPATWRMLLETGWRGDRGLKVLCGGEALPRDLAERLLTCCAALWNMYGPTETTIWSAVHQVASGRGPVPIGRPIANTDIYVLDPRYLEPQPVGVAGEIFIGGAGVAAGYWERPELTAERFIKHPFNPEPEARLYRTGDLGRYLESGEIEHLGRLDHQVKLRGFRIELGEIEVALCRHQAVLEAAVTLAGEDPDQRLVAYLVPQGEQPPDAGELRALLKESLPDYMVPAAYVMLEALPLTPNGKADRQALPAPEDMRREKGVAYLAPRNDCEAQLQGLWQEMLGVSPIGCRDDFFELGGHSFLAVRLVAAIEARMDKRVTLAALFQGRTIEALARIIADDTLGGGEEGFLALQSGGTRPPFCASGSHPRYRELARRLGPDQPFYQLDVYALQSQRLSRGSGLYQRIEDIAACYVAELQAIQPAGPYYLGGGCEGAYVAFEMALQLQQAGQEVKGLTLWIPPFLRERPGFSLHRTAPFRFAKQLLQFVRAGSYANLKPGLIGPLLKHEYIDYKLFRAIDRYLPSQAFQGEVMIVRTELSRDLKKDINQPWFDHTTKGGSVHIMSGHHGNWLDEERIDKVGELLKTFLYGSK